MVSATISEPSKRLMSLDAYRGLIMLAMASGGLALSGVADNADAQALFAGTSGAAVWQGFLSFIGYHTGHTSWAGCAFWDLIQPSFMFMVGVAMPFSYARRSDEGESELRRFLHVLFRSCILVLLGVFLSSNWGKQTNFTFVNVLTQIGLGYTFAYLVLRFGRVLHVLAILLILGGYWYYFYQFQLPESEFNNVTQYLQEERHLGPDEWSQFAGMASHWNKHTNAAAHADRVLLNCFPSAEKPWKKQRFWVNAGGYQTFNFIPSIATIIFGIMAGKVLRSQAESRAKGAWLFYAGAVCLLIGMGLDTNIWPAMLKDWIGASWSLCPVVKRIWTPSWAIFSAGWAYWMLAALYWAIDIKGWRRWALPFTVVGMNSITMYCMAQLLKPWISHTLRVHLTTVDVWFGWKQGIVYHLFNSEVLCSPIWERLAQLVVLWLICVWLYRKKIFIRI